MPEEMDAQIRAGHHRDFSEPAALTGQVRVPDNRSRRISTARDTNIYDRPRIHIDGGSSLRARRTDRIITIRRRLGSLPGSLNMVAFVKSCLAVLMLLLVTTPAAAEAQGQSASQSAAAARTGHVDLDGVRYAYKIVGQGEPMLVLHGGLGAMDMFDPILPALGAGRQLILVDLQGHGRTNLGNRPVRYERLGADMSALLTKLGYGQVDIFGYSFGGATAFQLALQHPEQVRRLAILSAGFSQDGFYPEMLPQQAQVGAKMADFMKDTPMYKSYMAVAPDKGEFPRLLDAMGDLMRQPFDWSADVPKLKMPVLLAFADSDMFRPEHVVKFYQLLGGGLRDAGWQREHMPRHRLAILPGRTHYDVLLAPQLVGTLRPFLDGREDRSDWAGQVKD
jgi:pimeloyl-ACP methyl ester carboxylesterase